MSDRQSHPEKFQEPSYRRALISEARALLDQLGDTARTVDLLDDYTWLANAVLQWQIAFSSVFEEPLRQEIPDPPKGLRPSYSREIIENKLREYAEIISLWRRQSQTSSKEEQERDWYQAQVYFASEVLDGRINLVDKLTGREFAQLENVWFRDAIKMKAYFYWVDRGRNSRQTDDERLQDYFYARHYYRWRLLHERSKYGPEYFDVVDSYVKGVMAQRKES